MSGFLRYFGVLSAAVWLGAAIFFTFLIGPAAFSSEMQSLIGPANYPYYSGAIAQILIGRYFWLQFICGMMAFIHVVAEWLYLGKTPRMFWLGLLIAIFAVAVAGGSWLQPKLKELHRQKYAVNATAEQKAIAAQTFRTWHAAAQSINLLLLVGLALHLWRVANPPDPTRFVSTAKFRS